MEKANIGLFGLAVMGSNLARNLASRDLKVAVCNRTVSVMDDFMTEFSETGDFIGCKDLAEFVKNIERPRKIILMVKAGFPTDATIESLLELLEPGDILMDGGNAWFKDTQRRAELCAKKQISFLGVGISGGETGALNGPSIMPGGEKEAWDKVADILAAIAAKVDSIPCTNYIGPDGAGHFVKMVHNGIEYADMQLIAESYHLMQGLLSYNPTKLAETFADWNEGVLSSFLIDITAKIFTKKDEGGSDYLVDKILDKAGQKGTGQWTAEVALSLGIPVPTINAAVNARTLSSFKDQRQNAAKILAENLKAKSAEITPQEIHDALYAAKIISYAQGMDLISAASEEYNWSLDLGSIAELWRGGCIIKARFLNDITEAYRSNPKLANLMLAEFMTGELNKTIPSLRSIVAAAASAGIPILGLSSALSYYDSYRMSDLPQNLTQAQRDFFGAHTYQRKDKEGTFHTEWEE